MDVVGIEIVRERRRCATVPTCYSTACTVHGAAGCEGKRAAARVGIERIAEEEGTAAVALQYPRCYSSRDGG